MKNTEISDVLERLVPHGPEPIGWAERARKGSVRRRAATGVAAIVVSVILVVPVVGQLLGRSVPTVLSTPTPSVDEGAPLGELPEECQEFAGVPDVAAMNIDEAVEGYYCFSPQEGRWGARELGDEDLVPMLGDIAAESVAGVSQDMATQLGHLYLIGDSGATLSVAQDVDGRFWWRQLDGTLMAWTPSGVSEARVEGTLTLTRVLSSGFARNLTTCWQETDFSTQPIAGAVSGVLCDPTGTTLEETELKIPQELVTQIVEQASSTWAPVASDDRHGSGRSVILLDDDGAAFHLNQLSDGSMTWQQPDGSDLQWTPAGDVADALAALGMKYLHP